MDFGYLEACHNDVMTKWTESVKWHSCEDKLGDYPFSKDRKIASAVRDPITYFEDCRRRICKIVL